MSTNDGNKSPLEKLASYITQPLWNGKPLSEEEAEELQKFAANPEYYVQMTRTGIQNNNVANVIEAQNRNRADRDERERNQEAP